MAASIALFRDLQRSSIETTVIAFSGARGACMKSRQWQQALHMFSDLQQTGIKANIITYNAAMST